MRRSAGPETANCGVQNPETQKQVHQGPHQPTQVETSSCQDGVDGITDGAFEPAACHAVIGLEVADDGFHRLTALELLAVFICHAANPATMFDQHAGVGGIYPAVAQIDHCLFDNDTMVITQDVDLLDLLMQRVAVIRIAGERSGTHYKARLMRDGNARLDAELVRVAGFALADALDFRGMQRIQLAFVRGLLAHQSCHPLQHGAQALQRLRR